MPQFPCLSNRAEDSAGVRVSPGASLSEVIITANSSPPPIPSPTGHESPHPESWGLLWHGVGSTATSQQRLSSHCLLDLAGHSEQAPWPGARLLFVHGRPGWVTSGQRGSGPRGLWLRLPGQAGSQQDPKEGASPRGRGCLLEGGGYHWAWPEGPGLDSELSRSLWSRACLFLAGRLVLGGGGGE